MFTRDTQRMLFGFSLVVVLAVLAVIIALGDVKPETSAGLDIVLGSLATLAGGFAQSEFGKRDKPGE